MKLAKLLQLEWERAAAVLCVLVGGVILVIGWFGASGTLDPGVQLPYILSGGIGGVFFLGLGATLWLSGDLRDEWCKLDAIDETLKSLGETPDFDVRTLISLPQPASTGPPAAVASPGRSR